MYVRCRFLADNQFTGPLPDLSRMAALQVLYAENNQLNGNLPNFNQLVSLEAINLSNNLAIQGTLPTTVSTRLKDFRVANCSLTGGVSSGLMRSISLQSLLIEGNKLTGPVPDPSSSIKVLNIANNQFGCFAPEIASGVNADITNNKFLCLPGTERIQGCVNPLLQQVVQLCSGASATECNGQATMRLEATNPPAVATITLDSTLSLTGCDDVYCYLGQTIQGKATLVSGAAQIKCSVKPAGVGVFSISLRRLDGVVLSTSAAPVTITVTAGCGTKQCSPPNGACTPNGCVCDQSMWTGQDCDKRVCPRNCLAASNQGTCNTATGECQCRQGTENGITFTWSGPDCSIKSLTCKTGGPSGAECSGRGQCVRATGKCNCQPVTYQVSTSQVVTECTRPPCVQLFYTGDACEKISCPQNGNELCSGHGTCNPNTFDSPCSCRSGASGIDCSIGTQVCNGCDPTRSRCNTFTGQCICAPGYLPPQCTRLECPSSQLGKYDQNFNYVPGVPCSGHGTCNNDGTCTCAAQWDLYSSCASQRIDCPVAANGMPCGGRTQGYCVPSTGECRCVSNLKRAFSGPSCDDVQCPKEWQGCSPCDATEECSVDPAVPPSTKGECKFRQVTPPGATTPITEPYCECQAATATSKGRAGDFCQDFACLTGDDGSECNVQSGQGTCDRGSGICICSEVGTKLDPKTGCSTLLCPGSNGVINCAGNGQCDGATGKCTCNTGAGGEACDQEVENWAAIGGGIAGVIILVLLCAVLVFCLLRRAAIRKLQNH